MDFFGFASKEGAGDFDVVDSLALIRYDQECVQNYFTYRQQKIDREAVAAQAEAAEEERLRQQQELREQEESEQTYVSETETEPEEEDVSEGGIVTEKPQYLLVT